MSKRFLSRVIAGAALGCASLLIAAPGTAMADGVDKELELEIEAEVEAEVEEIEKDKHKKHKKHKGWIYSVPEPAKAGHKAYIVQICKKEQEHAWAWSEATGKLKLEPNPYHFKEEVLPNGVAENGLLEELEVVEEELEIIEELEDSKMPEKGKVLEELEAVEEEVEELEIEIDEDFDPKGKQYHKKHDGKDKKDHEGKVLEELEVVEEELEIIVEEEEHDKKDWHPYAYWTKVWIPHEVEPGAYKLKGSCAKGELVVAPHGPVDGGDGGVGGGTNTGLVTGGAGMIAAASLGGLALMRRRATNGTLA